MGDFGDLTLNEVREAVQQLRGNNVTCIACQLEMFVGVKQRYEADEHDDACLVSLARAAEAVR